MKNVEAKNHQQKKFTFYFRSLNEAIKQNKKWTMLQQYIYGSEGEGIL